MNHRRLPRWHSGKASACQCRRYKRCKFEPSVRKIPWRRKWQPTLVFLPGKSHGQRRQAGCNPWGCKESHKTEQLSTALFPYYKCWGRKHLEGDCPVHVSLLRWETVSLEYLQGELLGLKMILPSCRPKRLYSPSTGNIVGECSFWYLHQH